MKNFRKTITVLLLVLCLTVSVTAYAQTAPEPPPSRYTLISVASSGLSISGSGLATCSASITGQVGVDSVKLTGYLQRYNGSSWVTIKSWTKSASGRYCSMSNGYYVSSGYSYRYRVYCTAYDGGSNETVIVTSYDSY